MYDNEGIRLRGLFVIRLDYVVKRKKEKTGHIEIRFFSKLVWGLDLENKEYLSDRSTEVIHHGAQNKINFKHNARLTQPPLRLHGNITRPWP